MPYYPRHPSKGADTKFGGPAKALQVPCFFSGELVSPGARASVTQVRLVPKGHTWEYQETGLKATVNVNISKVWGAWGGDFVLTACDGKGAFRIDALYDETGACVASL
jgi:hypothetical protein